MEAMELDIVIDENHEDVIKEFAILTNTNDVFSNEYLKNHSWDVTDALNHYYDEMVIDDMRNDDELNHLLQDDNRFRFLSWNLDGLDKRQITFRTKCAVKYIQEISPDVLFLQELVSESEFILRESFEESYYFFLDTQPDNYYCGIMVKKSAAIQVNGNLEVMPFQNSRMDRRLLTLTVSINGSAVILMTSHLESLKDSSQKRIEQMSTAFKQMKAAKCSSIFAGDMNIRDNEIEYMNGLPEGIVDVGLLFPGHQPGVPTWEPMRNFNISRDLAKVRGFRFDRMYVHSVANILYPIDFNVLFTTQNVDCNLHPSDHWGIHGLFTI